MCTAINNKSVVIAKVLVFVVFISSAFISFKFSLFHPLTLYSWSATLYISSLLHDVIMKHKLSIYQWFLLIFGFILLFLSFLMLPSNEVMEQAKSLKVQNIMQVIINIFDAGFDRM